MKRKVIVILFFLMSSFMFNFPAYSDEREVKNLKKQIEGLQKRVEELESSKSHKDDDPWGYYQHRPSRSWDPFEEMHRMQEQMDQMFQNSFTLQRNRGSGIFRNSLDFDADFDIKETDKGYEIVFDMTGLNKDEVDIKINEHSITVKGEHSSEETAEKPNSFFHSQSFGTFMKTIPLPVDADTANVKTEKEGDNLVIRMPKKKS